MSRAKLHCTNLSDEAFLALLDALGLQNEGNKRGEDLEICPYSSFLNVTRKYGDTTPPSQRRSFISGVNAVAPSSVPLSPSTNSVCLRDPTRMRRLVNLTRPRALYLPNGAPLSVLYSSINESTMPCLPSNPSSSRESSLDSPSPISIKAAFNATIVVLRVSRTISLAELKQRLYDKFVGQEHMLLSRRLTVVSVRPPSHNRAPLSSSWMSGSHSTPPFGHGQTRSQSSHGVAFRRDRSSLEPRRFSFAELTQMDFIEDEVDWQKVLARHCADGTKVTLRILDTPM